MSLLPIFDGDYLDWWRSARGADSLFDDEESLVPILARKRRRYSVSPYSRPWRSRASQNDTGSTVNISKDMFEVNLDVQQFEPNEITVRTQDNSIIVEGKHEEKQDEHGTISRQFVRRYVLPKGHDIEKVESQLSTDGVLTITAPKVDEKMGGRIIPIKIKNGPSRAIQNGDEKKQEVTPEKPEAKRRKKT